MQIHCQTPTVGGLACNREVFSRVWARAWAHDPATAPIQVLPPPEPKPSVSPPAPGPGEAPAGCPSSAPPQAARTDALLPAQIRGELISWRRHQMLSTRSCGPMARELVVIAEEDHRHAHRLSGIWFLLSGIRFFPSIPLPAPGSFDFWSEMRRSFLSKQSSALSYSAAAGEAADPRLSALYRELAAQERAHADRLHRLTEQMLSS